MNKLKIIILMIIFFILLNSNIYCDFFRIIDNQSNIELSNSAVYLDSDFIGYTDRYGRIEINIPNGDYEITISYMGIIKTANITVDGNNNILKRVAAYSY